MKRPSLAVIEEAGSRRMARSSARVVSITERAFSTERGRREVAADSSEDEDDDDGDTAGSGLGFEDIGVILRLLKWGVCV